MIDEAAIRRQIAAGLRRARRRAGITEEQFAETIAMSKSGLRHLEKARHPIRVEQLPTLARAAQLTVRELLIEMRLIRRSPERFRASEENPGPAAGASADESASGDRSTVCDPRGDASQDQHTARPSTTGTVERSS